MEEQEDLEDELASASSKSHFMIKCARTGQFNVELRWCSTSFHDHADPKHTTCTIKVPDPPDPIDPIVAFETVLYLSECSDASLCTAR